MNFLFVTVTDGSDESLSGLDALFRSIELQSVSGHVQIVRRGGPFELPTACAGLTTECTDTEMNISLSRARNAALNAAQQSGRLAGAGVVAFPDDDCAYSFPGSLKLVDELISAGNGLVGGVYAPDPELVDHDRFPPAARQLDAQMIMRTVSSNNVFFAGDALAQVGWFDEAFGLGAKFGAAEDCDLALRIIGRGFSGMYEPAVLVRHPYKANRPREYFRGNLAVLAVHRSSVPGVRTLYLRRLALGFTMVARRQMSVGEFRRAIGDAHGAASGTTR